MNVLKNILIRLLVFLAVLFLSTNVLAQEKTKVKLAIMPFTMNGPENLAYLQEGLKTMLASRVAARTGAIIVDSATDADLVLAGSITSLGPSLSIDAKLTKAAPASPESFFASAADQGEIISAVDKLAADIAASISGEPRRIEQPMTTPSVSGAAAKTIPSPDQTMHPDRIFRSPAPVIPTPGSSISTMPTPVVMTNRSVGQVNRSQFLDLEIQVMDVGDVFGEGTNQVVLAEKQKITVFRQSGGQLSIGVEAPAAPRHVRIVSLCLADLNGNGRAEIYVSAISGNTPISHAVEWNGNSFVNLYEKQLWYTRIISLPGKKSILAGQQAGSDYPVKQGIYRLTVSDGELVKGERLAIPEEINLFEFVLGDFTGDGQQEIAVHNQDDDLYLYSKNGDVLWQGSGNYGYTKRYIGPADSSIGGDKVNLQVPTRLIALDLNSDGRQELVAMKNPSGLGTIMRTVGSFVGGEIEILTWDGITFNELWSTGPIGNYIASYHMDVSELRLYIGMVSKSKGLLLSTFRSTVASYGMANSPQ